MDFILNGQANGHFAGVLMQNNFDVNTLRPYIGRDGRTYITQNQGGKPVAVPIGNAAASLRKDEWIDLDLAVVAAAKNRLNIVQDVRGAGLTYNIPNGMGKTILETETMSDITAARISMDPAVRSEGDRPHYEVSGLPLPIIHKDFSFNARQVATSRNTGASIDVSTAELAGRRVAEEIEKLFAGSQSFAYGGQSVYGLTNYPSRITRTITVPTDSGWTPATTVADVLGMRQDSEDALHYGPWVLFTAPAWDRYLDDDYSTLKGDNTLRDRLNAIDRINSIRTADYLSGFDMVLVQMTSDVIRAVEGMQITTLQWETNGGMTLNFKVMAIVVPQLRADYNGNTGIVHGADA
ncbi:MAG: hypothetical protein Unbinned3891contig1000_80 [Prokaryotic dsDNA virus sp.]|nr:MAG: hypothetical protein Unbinned3891contig1000_80 [Prokaryotic dsDNA virus sp.]|tara:strand:- start:45698 stop:46750 length:1053 start_codon:yes stop_codon:yes gene_type:complete